MSEPRPVSRRTVTAAAWSVPVVVTAVGSPLAAASGETPTLSARVGAPSVYPPGGTFQEVYFRNESGSAIDPNTLTLFIPTAGQGWTWQGFGGGPSWDYAPGGFTSTSFTFRYSAGLAPDQETELFYFLASNRTPGVEPAPTAVLTATAPGFTPCVVVTPIPY
ncbi:hypothetical protein [Rathayibacter sp. SD072]|uniref:hypothetical protein n=1 Tax=Rathayibacter sp. SD072 TaxID=2781731 RepID=UPI001A971B51|nr:hypothetical protein [Rathayibacter sp. SD072]MBO0983761.1 hypothetical protein [Rathayibacter sp. SD072]